MVNKESDPDTTAAAVIIPILHRRPYTRQLVMDAKVSNHVLSCNLK